ncbi:hypothetical protein IHE45_15G028700 [Dioscorea alata]|uniref:Uncharacterized protein n=1 Tax=Dioscorea alata TaxID=55571 RepID=A0ACB7UKD3_DIOAL|nr:hypothetical protein IHE45_15G028700 [Dioscorea alata]
MGNHISSELQKKHRPRRLPSQAALDAVTPAAAAATVRVIYPEGKMEEYKGESVKVEKVLERSSGCCLVSGEEMRVGEFPASLPDGEELRRGQLYFVLPSSAARQRLTLHELCWLAVTAHAAMQRQRLPMGMKEWRYDRR